MGNKFVRFDIVSNLPPELVLTILSYLSMKDVAKCTLVCQNWFNIIANLGIIWRKGVENIGFTRDAAIQCIPAFGTPRDFYISAVKYKNHMRSTKLMASSIEHAAPKQDMFILCLYANNGTLVQILKANSGREDVSNQLIVQKVRPTGSQNVITTQMVSEISLHKDTKVIWAHVKGENLYWISRCGIWSGYNLNTNQEVFTLRHPLLKEGHGITVACCTECSMVVASHWVPTYSNTTATHKSAHSLQIVNLTEGEQHCPTVIVNLKLFQQNHNHNVFVQHDSRYWLRKTHIAPSSSTKSKTLHGMCKSHRLILQSDCCVMFQSLEFQTLKDGDPHIRIDEPVCINCQYDMDYNEAQPSVKRVSSDIALSSDYTLIGQVFNKTLCVWKYDKQHDTLLPTNHQQQPYTMLSKSPLQQTTGICKGIKLVALGGILSIVAYLDDTYVMEYKIHIVLTKTGEVLSEFRRIEKFYNWTICCQIDPLHRFYFMCDSNSEWLDRVQHNVPETPIITVHNHHGKIHIEALQNNRTVSQTWRKYWRCAVNFAFHH